MNKFKIGDKVRLRYFLYNSEEKIIQNNEIGKIYYINKNLEYSYGVNFKSNKHNIYKKDQLKPAIPYKKVIKNIVKKV